MVYTDAGKTASASHELQADKHREHQTHQSFYRAATTAHIQSVTAATLVLRCNNQQEMWVVLTRNGFHFVLRIS